HITAPHQGRHVKIAQLGFILDVHQNACRPCRSRKRTRFRVVKPSDEQDVQCSELLTGGQPRLEQNRRGNSSLGDKRQPASEALTATGETDTQEFWIKDDR